MKGGGNTEHKKHLQERWENNDKLEPIFGGARAQFSLFSGAKPGANPETP